MSTEAAAFGALCRACRGALGWSQRRLADRAGVSLPTIARTEIGDTSPRSGTLQDVIRAFRDAGLVIAYDEPRGGFTLVVDANALASDLIEKLPPLIEDQRFLDRPIKGLS